MNQAFRIYTFGSDRHYRNFKKRIDNPNCEIIQINEESKSFKVSKSAKELLDEFKNLYKSNIQTKGFIIFGRATVKNGIENIAEAVELIKKEYLELQQTQVVGPSSKSAKIFVDKFLTQKVLVNNNIPTPKTYRLDFDNEQEFIKIIENINFPVVLKALNLSGGRGMRFVENSSILQKNITELKQKGIGNLLITEFIKGIEVTYTVLRLGDSFLRLPVSYKSETDEQLIHPDAKVKLSGFYNGDAQHYHYVEKIMRKYDIYGLFTLQGILFKNLVSSQYKIYFLEAATRITGSTPIMAAALKGFDLYKTIADWIIHKDIRFGYEKSFAIQYSSYQHRGISFVKKLSKLNWVVEAKYENLAEMPHANDKRDRIRISFGVNPQKNLEERLKTLSDVLKNSSYYKDVSDILCRFQKKD